MEELTLEDANRRLAAEGYPPIRRLPADEAALASWRRIVDARRELDATGRLSEATLVAVSSFCHCLKCPSYPRGELAVYCLRGKSEHSVTPLQCKCPTCAVYKLNDMGPQQYFCKTGVPEARLAPTGGVVEAAKRLLRHEEEKGNPGKRIAERLMAPPQLVGCTQEDFDAPEKVPGT